MNVFVIETPHQVLNALEARHSLARHLAELVVLESPLFSRADYDRVIRPSDWAQVHFVTDQVQSVPAPLLMLKHSRSSRLRGYFQQWAHRDLRKRLDALACSLGKVESVFLGNYWRGHIRHFSNVIQAEEIFLLDDGTQTLQINERMKKGQPFGSSKQLAYRFRLLDRLLGWRTEYADRVSFFTIYDLETRPSDRIYKNDYGYLRSIARGGTESDEVLFLGSPLAEDGLPLETYCANLNRVRRFFHGRNLIYLPHRRETQAMRSFIQEHVGVEMRSYGVPIEYELAINGTRPWALASFCSSALANCRIIMGETLDIVAFHIEPEEFRLNPELARNIFSAFERMAGHGFRVVHHGADDEYEDALAVTLPAKDVELSENAHWR